MDSTIKKCIDYAKIIVSICTTLVKKTIEKYLNPYFKTLHLKLQMQFYCHIIYKIYLITYFYRIITSKF